MQRVIVVDDHEFFRKGVIMTIRRFKDVEVVGEASNGEELLNLLTKVEADLILMDIKMPIMDGVEATERVLNLYPNMKVMALSMFSEEEYLERMLQVGAFGFLLKNSDSSELEKALKYVNEGKQYFSEEFIPYFTQKFVSKPNDKQEAALTARELEVLNLVALGMTNQQIADKLFLSVRTVTNHRANLNAKTGSKNTVNLLSYAIRNNLIKLD